MEYISSANDIVFTFGGTFSYYLECDESVIYWGKAQSPNGTINITRRIKDYLETGMPDFRDFNGVIVHHPKQLRTFYLRNESGVLLKTYTALLESTGEWSVFGPLTEPINGHTDPRQKIFWTTVEESGATYESNTNGAEYSGGTESGSTDYYFNYTTPSSQVFSATTTSTTISWETNYDSIVWKLYDVTNSEVIASGVTSSSSVTVTFPGNTGSSDSNVYEFRTYAVLDGSYLGEVSWNVSSPEGSSSGSTTGTTYSFTPAYTTAYTDGSDVIWYFETDCPDPVSLFIYGTSGTDGFSVSINERGSSYAKIKINSLPTETGKTAVCTIRIRGYESQGVIGQITIINIAASQSLPVDYFTIEPLSSTTKVIAGMVGPGATVSLNYRINEGEWQQEVFSWGGTAKYSTSEAKTLSNGEVIEKIEFYANKPDNVTFVAEPYVDTYHYIMYETEFNGTTAEYTKSVPYKASGDYASLV